MEAAYAELKEILDDPLALIQRLWELETQRREREPLAVGETVSRQSELN